MSLTGSLETALPYASQVYLMSPRVPAVYPSPRKALRHSHLIHAHLKQALDTGRNGGREKSRISPNVTLVMAEQDLNPQRLVPKRNSCP